MTVLVVTPAEPFVTLEEAKAHLRDPEGEDDLIESYIAAACGWIDGPAGGGWLGRSISRQTLAHRCDDFCCDAPLPYGPVTEIQSIKYRAPSGAEETVDPSAYILADDRPVPAPGAAWPTLRGDRQGVTITYAAGAEPEAVPAPVKQAVLLLVGQWFRNRMAVNVGNIVNEMPFAVEALLSPFRRWS